MNVIQRHRATAKAGQIFGPGAMRALARELTLEQLRRAPTDTPPSRQVLRRQVALLKKGKL